MKMIIISFLLILTFFVTYELKIFLVCFKPTPRLDCEQKASLSNLEECIYWVKDKLKREDSNYQLTKEDLEDIEMAYDFQTSEVNQRSYN